MCVAFTDLRRSVSAQSGISDPTCTHVNSDWHARRMNGKFVEVDELIRLREDDLEVWCENF
jgi:hypothetical protein